MLGILLLTLWPVACLYDGVKLEPEAVEIDAINLRHCQLGRLMREQLGV